MSNVRSVELSGETPEAIRSGLDTLLAGSRFEFDDGSRILVVPDVHYPHHASTGLVTNPDVVEALVDVVDAETGSDVGITIGISSSEFIEANRVSRYLRYDAVAERTGADIVDLGGADSEEVTVPFVDGSVTLDVPAPLSRDVVVPIPTLRSSPRYGLAAGMVTLARAVTESPTPEEILATVRAVWPSFSILDATYAYDGSPRKMDLLLASDDLIALNGAAAERLGIETTNVLHLAPDRSPPTLRRSVNSAFGGDGTVAGDDAMARGYRLYARLADDLVPPQMISGGDQQ